MSKCKRPKTTATSAPEFDSDGYFLISSLNWDKITSALTDRYEVVNLASAYPVARVVVRKRWAPQ